jgi:hypothetical protein
MMFLSLKNWTKEPPSDQRKEHKFQHASADCTPAIIGWADGCAPKAKAEPEDHEHPKEYPDGH